jgi:NADPH:quinone reductase-like Zn-dependent oxidoreductase
MSFDDAATLPHAAVLAVQGLRLRDGRRPKAGDRVVIDGAAGSVGPLAVQIATSFGVEVTGIDGAEKLEMVRSLGADHVIDYRTTDYTQTGERYDWILDVHAHHRLLDCRRALRPGGIYVTLGGPTARLLTAMVVGPVVGLASRKRMGLMLWWKPFGAADVETLTRLHASGDLKPVIDRRYPLDDVVTALRYVDDGHARGKVLVIP